MEQLKFYIFIGFLAVCTLMVVMLSRMTDQMPAEPLGSMNQVYNYQQFTGAIATTTALKVGVPGTFGGVVITEDSATAVVFYDATSSAAITNGVYSTRIADMEAALTEGVYMFNVPFQRGLIMQSTDGFTFAGDWTVLFN
jgi:hypothetical protein